MGCVDLNWDELFDLFLDAAVEGVDECELVMHCHGCGLKICADCRATLSLATAISISETRRKFSFFRQISSRGILFELLPM